MNLYKTTNLSVVEICRRTNTPVKAFRAFLQRSHRDLLFARYGIKIPPKEAAKTLLRKSKGQSPQAYIKYKEAISACDDIKYIEYNISQIARLFHVTPIGLSQQLRSHFPEILERREKERQRLGINDNFLRGTSRRYKQQYVAAIEHLRNSDDTIVRTAELFNVSYTGLRSHLLYYNKALVDSRENKRIKAKGTKKLGAITGNGRKHLPSEENDKIYKEAIRLYRTTAMTMDDIVKATGITFNGFKNYLRMWHIDLMLERRGITSADNKEETLRTSKQYLKSTAAKYAEAIEELKINGESTAVVAKKYNLNSDSFREYLYEHEPELAERLGMTILPNGKRVLARSANKYDEAIGIYKASTESLKSISARLGIQYKSIGGFIRRNYPDIIEIHNRLVEEENQRRKEQARDQAMIDELRNDEKEKQLIIEALKSADGNKRHAAKILGICRSTLYNKLKVYQLE